MIALPVAMVVGIGAGYGLWKWGQKPQLNLTPECRSKLEKVYTGDELKIAVLFGYKDARPARFVGDRYERLLFIDSLMSPCKSLSGRGLCGFKRDEKDPELFTKTGVSPFGRDMPVSLRVIDSSAGPDDQANRRNPFQRWKSERARAALLTALNESQVVAYDGHSRVGGGPDFFPPKIYPSGKVAYESYLSGQQGLVDLEQGLKSSGSQAVWVGLFSCASTQFFNERLRRARPGLQLWSSSELLYFSDALEKMREALNRLLSLRCT